jgi:hypothetical protein
MDVAPVGVTSVMGYSCLNKVVDPVIFRQEPTSRYSPRITPSTPLARSALPRERFRCVLGMLSSLEVKVLRPT